MSLKDGGSISLSANLRYDKQKDLFVADPVGMQQIQFKRFTISDVPIEELVGPFEYR